MAVSTVQGGTNYEAPDDKAAYILFKMLPPEGGSGTEADPYIVKDMESFNKISNMIRDEDATYFKMTADLDFSAVTFTEENPWTPINSVACRPLWQGRFISMETVIRSSISRLAVLCSAYLSEVSGIW